MRIARSYPLALAGATLAVALSVSTMSASAASTFLLQFGQHDSEGAARQQWDELQRAYPELLNDKSLRIAPVTGAAGSETYRTQASGIAGRDEAQATCNAMNADNVTCLVVETSMYMPAQQEAEVEVEMVSDEMDGVSIEDETALESQPMLAQAETTTTETVIIEEAPKEQERSFVSGFLPWLDDEPTPAPAAAETVTITETTTTEIAPLEAEAEAAPIEVAQQAQPVEMQAAPRPQRVEQVEAQAWPEQIDRSTAVQMSEELPAGETRVVESRAPRSLNAQVQQAEAAPVAPAQQSSLAPQVAPQPSYGGVDAEIEVAEAIQVPLSFDAEVAAPAPVNKPVGYAGLPSQPLPKRTLWVQLSSFVSKEAAMNYWRQLSAQNPELMRMLRIRIVTPWKANYSQRTASLRMGPFADQNAINDLCATAAQQNLRCSMVKEMAGSTVASNTRTMRTPEQAYQRRQATPRSYSRAAGMPPSGMFWVQLGAFDSVPAAQERWGQMQTVHADALGRLQPQISYPALSSSPTPVYHLRTGPFVTQSAAMNLCSRLQSRSLGCIVVQAR